MRNTATHWRANFLTGLAIILPAVITVAVVRWLFGTISNFTDTLLIFLPSSWTHDPGVEGPHWYWSLVSLVLAAILITVVGRSARYYLGRKLIQTVDLVLSRIPLLNRIYSAVKQVNQAFSPNQQTAFKRVVLVEFPRAGSLAIGFVTGEKYPQFESQTGRPMLCVFVPTTPNPTGGFLLIVPEGEVTQLDMTVADGIKFILSLGAIAPEREAGLNGAGPLPAAASRFP